MRIPLRAQIAGLLVFFVAAVSALSMKSTMTFLEQNKVSNVRDIQTLQIAQRAREIEDRILRTRNLMRENAYRLLDPARGSIDLNKEQWFGLKVRDKMWGRISVPTLPQVKDFYFQLSPDSSAILLFEPLEIRQNDSSTRDWIVAQVSKESILGRTQDLELGAFRVLVTDPQAGQAWIATTGAEQKFSELFKGFDAKSRTDFTSAATQALTREIRIGASDEESFLFSWSGIKSGSSERRLVIVSFIDRGTVMKEFRRFIFEQAFYSFALLVLGLMVALFVSRRLSKPVEEMAKAARVLEKGDFNVRVEVARRDEIGDLAGAFNHMGQALAEREIALKEAQATIVQGEKLAAIGTLSAGIAHEVKNPLAGILGNADLVSGHIKKLGLPNEAMLLRYIEVIQKETKRCKGIIDSLMKFSREEKVEMSPIDLEVVCWETIFLVEHSLNIANVRVEKQFDDNLKMVLGNSNQVEQVFLNMVQNAGQAMPQGGVVTIGTRYYADSTSAPVGRFVALESPGFEGPFCRVEIKDTGIGMPIEVQKKIFEPFFTTKPKGVGTGLGLAVTMGILSNHKSRISINSASGEGTCFWLDFMAKQDRTPHVLEELKEFRLRASGGAKVSSDVGSSNDTQFPEKHTQTHSKSRPPPPKKTTSPTAAPAPAAGPELSQRPIDAAPVKVQGGVLRSPVANSQVKSPFDEDKNTVRTQNFQIRKPQAKGGVS